MRQSEHREIKPALVLACMLFGAVLAVSAWREWDVRKPAPGTIGSQQSCKCCPRCGCPGEDHFCKQNPMKFVAQ